MVDNNNHTWSTCPGKEILELTTTTQKEELKEVKVTLAELIKEVRNIGDTARMLVKQTENGINRDMASIYEQLNKLQESNKESVQRIHTRMQKWLYVFYALIAVLIATNPQFSDFIKRFLPIFGGM